MKRYLFFLLLLMSFSGLRAQQSEALTPTLIAEMNKPSVGLVQANYKAKVTIPAFVLNSLQLTLLNIQQNIAIQNGELEDDPLTILSWRMEKIFSNPEVYYQPASNYLLENQEVSTGGFGTGFLITSDGYLITNAHVVKPNEMEVRMGFIIESIESVIQQDLQDLEESQGITLSEELRELHYNASVALYAKYMTMGPVMKEYTVAFGVPVPGEGMPKLLPATVINVGEASTGRDVALLKVELEGQPTVKIGNFADLRTGEDVYVMGYPDAATFSPMISGKSILTPTFTKGIVSALKTTVDDRDVMQIDAATTHGNSGGPVFNKEGEVVGILTFGSLSQTTNQEVQGMNFALAVHNIDEFLGDVKPQYADISGQYREALEDFDRHYYSKALESFKKIRGDQPEFPYLGGYIADCERLIEEGKDETPGFPMIYLIAGGGGLLLIILGFLLFRRKKA